jgi:glycerophosphoryl diester phosphodiesterase
VSTRLTGPDRFLVIGHRGSPKRFAENTAASFDEALRSGADGFETDLRILADRNPVLFHDDELEGRTVETLSAADFRASGRNAEPLVTLARFAGMATMVLEVKRGGWEDILVACVASWPKIVVASFDHVMIAELARRKAPFPLGITTSDRIVDVDEYVTRYGASWFFPNYRRVEASDVQSLHARGVRVVPWTVNRESDWTRLLRMGCDGVITDLPADAAAWRTRVALA